MVILLWQLLMLLLPLARVATVRPEILAAIYESLYARSCLWVGGEVRPAHMWQKHYSLYVRNTL